MNWTCTGEPRWLEVEKTYPVDNSGFTQHYEHGKLVTEKKVTVRVLQVKWQRPKETYDYTAPMEFDWRDVPVVKEER